ncbi:hypothetical protein B7494_g2770 [Chlorociboria aeruginascens]|nr:hypothetical protein B7494_g2770 [Chlorociboria aeruginascens]
MFYPDKQIHYHFHSKEVSSSEDPLRANVYLVALDRAESSSPSIEADAWVFGEFNTSTSTSTNESKDVLRFCESARQVFQAQPTRRFLHGFQINGSIMELWVFDRGCLVVKGWILQSPSSWIKTMVSYAMMNDEEVGFNSFIKQDGWTRKLHYIWPSTTCYVSRRLIFKSPNLVVNAWREDKRHTELEILTLTKERNVWGVIKLLGCQDLESIESLRQGLQFTKPYDFL